MNVGIAFPDDGSILVEWISSDFRIGFSIESILSDSSWYVISNSTLGDICESGYLFREDRMMEIHEQAYTYREDLYYINTSVDGKTWHRQREG